MLFISFKIHSNSDMLKWLWAGGTSIIAIDGILWFSTFSYSEHKVMVCSKTNGILDSMKLSVLLYR